MGLDVRWKLWAEISWGGIFTWLTVESKDVSEIIQGKLCRAKTGKIQLWVKVLDKEKKFDKRNEKSLYLDKIDYIL